MTDKEKSDRRYLARYVLDPSKSAANILGASLGLLETHGGSEGKVYVIVIRQAIKRLADSLVAPESDRVQ